MFAARNKTLNQLIGRAYDADEEYQISGGPAWAEAVRYDVDARPAGASTQEQMNLMLRTLLADRFELRFHRETKQVALNVLSVAPGGPKIGPQFHAANENDPPAASSKPVADQLHFPRVTIKTFAIYLRLNLSSDLVAHTTTDFRNIPPVLDQTGLAGTYDIVLNTGEPMDWPSLLQRQLGLKLELRKMPTEIIVIDSASKPAGN
jgi:uncharacterized protein (TIGR03435 family)